MTTQLGTLTCYRCGSGRHELPLLPGEECGCKCHYSFVAEATADAREDLSDWLGLAVGNTKDAAISLLRAHSAATRSDPVAALELFSLFEDCQRITQRLAALQGVKS